MAIVFDFSGCAGPLSVWKNQPPPYSSIHTYQQINGNIGVVAAQFEPKMDFQALLNNHQNTVVTGGVQGAAVGAAVGTGVGLVVLISSLGACLNPAAAATCPSVGAIIAGGAVAGGAVGASVGKAAENKNKEAAKAVNVKDVASAISQVLQSQNFQQSVQDRIVHYGSSTTKLPFNTVASIGPVSPEDKPDYSKSNISITTNILEVRVLEATLRNDGRFFDSPYGSLVVTSKVRLIRSFDRTVLYESEYRHVSAPMYHVLLASDDAVKFNLALQLAYQDLAQQIVDQIFLVYEPAHERNNNRNNCLLSPLKPISPKPPKGSMCGWSCDRGAFISSSKIPKIDSLHSQMTWESFPTVDELKDDKDHELAMLNNVSYEVKIYSAVPAFPEASMRKDDLVPGELIESGTTQEPKFQPKIPLEDCGNYFWTFRARFNLNGQPKVTEWAGTYNRQLESCWDFGSLPPKPSRTFYPFKSVCSTDIQKATASNIQQTAEANPITSSSAPSTDFSLKSIKGEIPSKIATTSYLEGAFLSKQIEVIGLAGLVKGLNVKFTLSNLSEKEITKLIGKAIILDDTGKEIGSISFHSIERIPSHNSIEISQTVYPIIFSGYAKLKELDQEKIKAKFTFESIEFLDGTKFNNDDVLSH